MLVQSKPILSMASTNSYVPLLQTHRRHSRKVEGTENDAPIFVLSKGDASALEDYAETVVACPVDKDTLKVVSNSFSLLICLYQSGVDEPRRVNAVSHWLKGVVASDVENAIGSSRNIHDSIFAALSGGNASLASSLALESGYSRLAVILSSTDASARSFFESQLTKWDDSSTRALAPTGILRIFSLARGSTSVEEEMFKSDITSYDVDWRRRLGMKLWSCSTSTNSVSSIVQSYSSDISAGRAPPPLPLYVGSVNPSTSSDKCVLFQLLVGAPIADVANPSSHTSCRHDYSYSFHIAAASLSMAGLALSMHHEDLIVDSLAAQLVLEGAWEWAVYATLSNFGGAHFTARRLRAKGIVARFYSPSSDPSAASRRVFLESLGVPSEWFDEVGAYRSGTEGNVLGYIDNLFRSSLIETIHAVEKVLIPTMILAGKEPRKNLLKYLDLLNSSLSDEHREQWDKSNCSAILDYLLLLRNVEDLSEMPVADLAMHNDTIDDLMVNAMDLQTIFLAASRSTATAHMIKLPRDLKLAPPSIYLTEAMTSISNLQLHLAALKNGEIGLNFNGESQLAFSLNFGEMIGSSSSASNDKSILRGLCGMVQ